MDVLVYRQNVIQVGNKKKGNRILRTDDVSSSTLCSNYWKCI